jgi:hypothetical protein
VLRGQKALFRGLRSVEVPPFSSLRAIPEHAWLSRLACDWNRTRTTLFGRHHDIQSPPVYFDFACKFCNLVGLYTTFLALSSIF